MKPFGVSTPRVFACSLCGCHEPRAGCPKCEERQPTLFSLSPPPIEDADTTTIEEISKKMRDERSLREERLRYFAGLERPIKIGLVGCAKTKRSYETRARHLYVSPLFKATLAYAEAVCDETFVASAFHGLVPVDEFVRPYDRTLRDLPKRERLAWGGRLVDAVASRFTGLPLHLMVFAGVEYTQPIQAAVRGRSWEIEAPLVRLSIGQRLQCFGACEN